jgi:GT2 family glycosyltransferase
MPDNVTAVVLNWNSADDTKRCVEAVLAGTVKPGIVVVDNGSDEPLDSAHVALDTNLGYAGGMNAGIRAAAERGAEWVWLLNADCVPRPDALERLLPHLGRFLAMTSLQVTSASPSDADAEPYVVAADLPNGRVRPVRCRGCADGVHEVDVVTGAAILLNVRAAESVGLFDERFFHYKEEFDLVRRIALDGGRVGFVCSSTVWHHVGGSLDTASPRARYYHHRNEVLYVRKHYRRPLARLLVEPVHYRVLATSVVGALAGRRGSRAVLAGYWDGVRGVHGRTERF